MGGSNAFYFLPLILLHAVLSEGYSANFEMQSSAYVENACIVLTHIANKYFTDQSAPIHVAVKSNSGAVQQLLYDVVDCVLHNVNDSLVRTGFSQEETFERRIFNMFLIDSYESFRFLSLTAFDPIGFFVVYVSDAVGELDVFLKRLFKHCFEFYVLNVSVVIAESLDKLNVYSYFPFTAAHCRKIAPVVISSFMNGFMKGGPIYPEKLKNLYKCPLTIKMTRNHEPFVKTEYKNGVPNLGGIEGEYLKLLSDKMNFFAQPVFVEHDWQNMEKDILSQVMKRKVDMALGFHISSNSTRSQLSYTRPHYQTAIKLIIPVGRSFEPAERLYLPFDNSTWWLFSFVLSAAFITIAVFKLTAQTTQQLVFGEGNSYPSHNLWIVMLGGGVVRPPKGIFARYLLILWIVFSLVLRGAYQGSLYNMIRLETGKRPPSTDIELINANYTLLLTQTMLTEVSNLTVSKMRFRIIFRNYPKYLNWMESTVEKVALLCSEEHFYYYRNMKGALVNMYLLEDSVSVLNLCVFFRKGSYLSPIVDFWLNKFLSAGLIQKFTAEALGIPFRLNNESSLRPRIFNMGNFLGVFELFAVCIIFSMCVFFVEVLFVKITSLKRSLITS